MMAVLNPKEGEMRPPSNTRRTMRTALPINFGVVNKNDITEVLSPDSGNAAARRRRFGFVARNTSITDVLVLFVDSVG